MSVDPLLAWPASLAKFSDLLACGVLFLGLTVDHEPVSTAAITESTNSSISATAGPKEALVGLLDKVSAVYSNFPGTCCTV